MNVFQSQFASVSIKIKSNKTLILSLSFNMKYYWRDQVISTIEAKKIITLHNTEPFRHKVSFKIEPRILEFCTDSHWVQKHFCYIIEMDLKARTSVSRDSSNLSSCLQGFSSQHNQYNPISPSPCQRGWASGYLCFFWGIYNLPSLGSHAGVWIGSKSSQ